MVSVSDESSHSLPMISKNQRACPQNFLPINTSLNDFEDNFEEVTTSKKRFKQTISSSEEIQSNKEVSSASMSKETIYANTVDQLYHQTLHINIPQYKKKHMM